MNTILIVTFVSLLLVSGIGLYFYFRPKVTKPDASDEEKKQNESDYYYAKILGVLSVILVFVNAGVFFMGSKSKKSSTENQETQNE